MSAQRFAIITVTCFVVAVLTRQAAAETAGGDEYDTDGIGDLCDNVPSDRDENVTDGDYDSALVIEQCMPQPELSPETLEAIERTVADTVRAARESATEAYDAWTVIFPWGRVDYDTDELGRCDNCPDEEPLRSRAAETTLRQLPSGNFAVDSFFDTFYEICPGSLEPSPPEQRGVESHTPIIPVVVLGGNGSGSTFDLWLSVEPFTGGHVWVHDMSSLPAPTSPETCIDLGEMAFCLEGTPL